MFPLVPALFALRITLFLLLNRYMVAMVGSTIINAALIDKGIDRNIAFFSSLAAFAFLNFLILDKINSLVAEKESIKKE